MSQEERKKIEAEIGVAKVGKRYFAADPLPPSAWRRTLKPWAALILGMFLGATVAGVLSVFVEVVR